MGNIELVIDISNSLYEAINNKCVSPAQIDELCRVVLNGKKLWNKRFEECGRCYWDEGNGKKDEITYLNHTR